MLFPHGDNLQRFSDRVPFDEMEDRLAQYNILRRSHFSEWEAIKIITTLTNVDKEGNRYLQKLNLETDAWQTVIQERKNWYNNFMNQAKKHGLNWRQANRAASRELQKSYEGREGDSRKDPTPWGGIREYYRIGASPRETGSDWDDSLRKRQQRYKKNRMPYRAIR